MHSKSFLLGYVYRPPDSKQMLIDTFKQQLNIADTHNLDIYTVGDFDINFSTVTGFQNTKWSNLIADYNLTQLITHPTRVTKVSSSTIDHLYTNHSEKILEIDLQT